MTTGPRPLKQNDEKRMKNSPFQKQFSPMCIIVYETNDMLKLFKDFTCSNIDSTIRKRNRWGSKKTLAVMYQHSIYILTHQSTHSNLQIANTYT